MHELLTQVYQKYLPALTRYAEQCGGGPMFPAHDALAEAYIKLWEYFTKNPEDVLTSQQMYWALRSTVRNKQIDFRRALFGKDDWRPVCYLDDLTMSNSGEPVEFSQPENVTQGLGAIEAQVYAHELWAAAPEEVKKVLTRLLNGEKIDNAGRVRKLRWRDKIIQKENYAGNHISGA